MCNECRVFSPVDEWGYGCPQCGHGNGRQVSYSEYPGVQIVPDIDPYRSMLDGSMIDGRAQHRQHLKRHDAVEIGNDSILHRPPTIPDTAPQQRRELLRAQFDAIDNKQFKQFLKRDIDRVKWNSRER